MFYSTTPSLISDNSSYLHSQQVFSGQYWDEFAMTGYFVSDQAQVLMLGLSLGGGVRPLLSADKKIALTCVDIDAASAARCRQFYDKHFVGLEFQIQIADAQEFLEKSNHTYNAIWLDIYLEDSYSPLYFSDEFYKLIKKNLKEGGHLLVNAYGLPNQFQPLNRSGAQFQTATILQKNFAHVAAIPYRRNITFVATDGSISIQSCRPKLELSPMDQTVFRSMQARLVNLTPLPKPLIATIDEKTDTTKFVNLDGCMRGLWSEVISELKKYEVSLQSPTQLLKLVENEALMNYILHLALRDNSSLLIAIPILCSGESHLHDMKLDWIFAWLRENAAKLHKKNPALYYQVWLPQLFAMVTQTSKKYKKHYFCMLSLLRKEFA